MVERSGGDDVPASTTRRATLCGGLELTCNTKTQSLNIGHAIPVGITKMMQPFLSFSTLSTVWLFSFDFCCGRVGARTSGWNFELERMEVSSSATGRY